MLEKNSFLKANNYLRKNHNINLKTIKNAATAHTTSNLRLILQYTIIITPRNLQRSPIKKLDPLILKKLYGRAIISVKLSLNHYINESFRVLLHYINPIINALLFKNHGTIYNNLRESLIAKIKLINEDIRYSLSKVHFLFNIWISFNNLPLLNVVIYYILRDHGL